MSNDIDLVDHIPEITNGFIKSFLESIKVFDDYLSEPIWDVSLSDISKIVRCELISEENKILHHCVMGFSSNDIKGKCAIAFYNLDFILDIPEIADDVGSYFNELCNTLAGCLSVFCGEIFVNVNQDLPNFSIGGNDSFKADFCFKIEFQFNKMKGKFITLYYGISKQTHLPHIKIEGPIENFLEGFDLSDIQ